MSGVTPKYEWYGGPFGGGEAEVVKQGVGTEVHFVLTPEQANDGTVLPKGSKYKAPVEERKGRLLILWHRRTVILPHASASGSEL